MAIRGVKILEVERGSAADSIGLVPGDRILSVNDQVVDDQLGLQFYLAEESINLKIRQSNGLESSLYVDLSDRSGLGIKVEEFRTLTCNNACLFCFVDQLPPGVRRSLRVKDDDYRLSFLHGNYVTLTNLSDRGLDRIIEQRLSPLFVSVHATDPVLRARMLGREKAYNLERKIERLINGGIRLHTQIVLIPKMNDGKHLEKTVFDLYNFYPGVQSVAIVPLGLSDHGKPKDRLIPVTPAYSRRIIRQAMEWQKQFREQIGRTFAYLADEFYLQAGVDIPESDHYDDFAQVEDGVGMVRAFLDEFEEELKRLSGFRLALRGSIVTGRLFYPILQLCIERLNDVSGSTLQVYGVHNRFMGKRITVAGLLGGRDLLGALSRRNTGDFIIIPNEAVSRTERILIDDFSLEDLSERFGKAVYTSGRTVAQFFQLLLSLAGH
jgi:putative radical SAM enzyme (TIGR03279 family)